jgi:hypothetical protein
LRKILINAKMSGFEIAGIVLALVPLALEGYDRSWRVFEVFSIFKQYPREVDILEAKLGAQRTIFRNNCIDLLTAITKDRVKVQEVIDQPSSKVARQGLVIASLYQNRVDALDESFVACRRTIEEIHHTLELLCLQLETFRVEVGRKQEVSPDVSYHKIAILTEEQKMNTLDWLKHLKNRSKLSLNKPQIEKAIEELRGFNKDFRLITKQLIKALQEMLNERKKDATLSRKSARSLNILQRYYRVRYASKALYSTLQVRWTCSSHRFHLFDVRILDCDPANGKDETSVAQYVTCELAITHDGSSYASKRPLRLEIIQACESNGEHSSFQQMVKHNANIQLLTTVLKTNADQFKAVNSTATTAETHKVLSGFRKDREQQPRPSAPAPQLPHITQSLAEFHLDIPTSMTVISDTTSDLSLVDDFCKKFQNAMTDCMDRSLLASWDVPHGQWFCVPSTAQTALGTSQSLSEIIRWIAKEPILRSLPRPLLVELAGNLAEGIMQFYSTPWLRPTNMGQIVRYFNPAGWSASTIQLKGPYFMVQLESTQAKGEMHATCTDSLPVEGAADFMEARNKLLFNFGILLLEIGFERPWQELKQHLVMTPTPAGEKLSDYRAAEKLAQLLINRMGLTYSNITKKCLGCDFGLGETDLDNEDLQRRFLEDVVSKLQELRDHMKEMNFAT